MVDNGRNITGKIMLGNPGQRPRAAQHPARLRAQHHEILRRQPFRDIVKVLRVA